MRNNDSMKDYKAMMIEGFAENDATKVAESFDIMNKQIAEEVEAMVAGVKMDADRSILQARGVRQLTSEERNYYEKLSDAMRAEAPMQALSNMNLAMPTTVIEAVFEDLKSEHPLLSKIDFIPTSGIAKWLMNNNEAQSAVWGTLCAEIVKELSAGFREVDTNLLKLSAFLPVCKATLELGYEWLDSFVRQTLYEALANGLEAGIVTGDGNGKPIGMISDVHTGVSVVGGAYPQKTPVAITDFSPTTVGALLAQLAVDEQGKTRKVDDVILLVNPVDYFTKVMPATTIMAPDGTYRNNVLPYPMTIIQSTAVPSNRAIIGSAKKYFAAAGMDKNGKIEYSDQYQFLEDNRVYLIKLYANGFPKDDNAFKLLDITNVKPATLKVEMVTGE